MATLVQKNFQQAKKKNQYKGVREEWIKHNSLIFLRGLNIYIYIYMENEYPLVERFMYLFMVVLQVCTFSTNDTILAQEDIHLALLSIYFSPPPLTFSNSDHFHSS